MNTIVLNLNEAWFWLLTFFLIIETINIILNIWLASLNKKLIALEKKKK